MRFLLIFLAFSLITGCNNKNEYTLDELHIYPQDTYNNGNVLPFSFKIKGGERHLNKIDWGEDALPTSAKSCHHGGEILSNTKAEIKAFYDSKNIYLEITWEDKTKDDKSAFWKDEKYNDYKDDGISIVISDNQRFNCTQTCHMGEWKVEEGKFESDYRMFNEKENTNLVLLRAAKTKNKPVIAIIGREGKKNLVGEEIFIFNSKNSAGKLPSFQLYQTIGNKNDSPLFPDKQDVFILNEHNNYLEGKMKYGFNHWRAIIKIPKESLKLKNAQKGDKIYFAAAVFDGTQINHSISDTFTAIFE